MTFPAIRFSMAGMVRSDLDGDSLAVRGASESRDGAVVYVIRSGDLRELRAVPDLVEDRGAAGKKGWQLSRYLLGRSRMPAVEGRYTAAGRLKQSVRSFLARAAAAGDSNTCFVGADSELFDLLWEEAGHGEVRARLPEDASEGARRTLGLLPKRSVPPPLRERFAGDSVEAELVRRLILQAAEIDDPVLILGQTGTGKELVARAIHQYHPKRSGKKFVAINCGAIPDELLESELFGHVKGAFTGALTDKTGLWEDADGGTLFLDEIGDLSLEHQAKTLRALQHGEIRRLGSTDVIRVNARVIAATNRDLSSMRTARLFREDLYQRLCGLVVRTPSLGEHPEEIPNMAQAFWKTIANDPAASLPRDILDELEERRWPGNVRELKKVLRNLHSLFGAKDLRADHLKAIFQIREQAMALEPVSADRAEIELHRAECLRHMRRASELVRSCEVALGALLKTDRPGGRGMARIEAAVRSDVAELAALCRKPLLFSGEAAYRAVLRLTEELECLERRAGRQASAEVARAKDNLTLRFSQASSALFREAAKLVT
jgi:transcriptional regulator with AAA-type ATPase domain